MLGELPSCWRERRACRGYRGRESEAGGGQEAGRGRGRPRGWARLRGDWSGPEEQAARGSWAGRGHCRGLPGRARKEAGGVGGSVLGGRGCPSASASDGCVRWARPWASPDSVSSPVTCGKGGFPTRRVVEIKPNGKCSRGPRSHPRGEETERRGPRAVGAALAAPLSVSPRGRTYELPGSWGRLGFA